MRIFGSDKMEMLLAHKHIGLREGEALAHPLISKALERAQGKVEGQNFEIRKNLLKFDNVMNDQRKVIYEQRREIMSSDDVNDIVTDMRHNVIDDLVMRCIPPRSYAEQWDTETLANEVSRLLALDLPIADWAKEEGIADTEITERIREASDKKMAAKVSEASPKILRQVEKALLLQTLDKHWKEHLLNLDHLRQGISLRAFGQRDPLNEYKTEAFNMFSVMLDQLRESITQTLSLVEFNIDPEAGQLIMRRARVGTTTETRDDPAVEAARTQSRWKTADNIHPFPQKADKPFDKNDPETWGKVARNETCPCGSGKKYKHCHGKLT